MNEAPQRILFISYSGGTGHTRAAEALHEYCQKYYPEITSKHLNATKYTNWFLQKTFVDWYHSIVQHRPELFKKIFTYSDTIQGKKTLSKIISLFKKSSLELTKQIKQFKPTRIICTHFIVPALLTPIADQYPIDVLVTDYYANRIWVNPEVRHIFVANKEIKKDLEHEHPSIIVSGIPIHPNFYTTKNTDELRKNFNITNTNPLILVLSGGMGLIDSSGFVEQILKTFSSINLVAIAGKENKKLYNKLKKLEPHNNHYIVIDFEKRIDDLMRIADVIVTKPGGLTVSEVLYLQKSLIVINPIAGHEEKNAEYVVKNKYGILAHDGSEIIIALKQFLNQHKKITPYKTSSVPAEIILGYK